MFLSKRKSISQRDINGKENEETGTNMRQRRRKVMNGYHERNLSPQDPKTRTEKQRKQKQAGGEGKKLQNLQDSNPSAA